MKKPDKPFEKQTTHKNPDIKSIDNPIIHNEAPDYSDELKPLTDLPEKTHEADWSEPEDITTTVYYKDLKISSPAFDNNAPIPSKFTCDGLNVNPPIEIENIPPEAKCLALIVDDPDAPGTTFVHWLAWNIPVTHHIKENEIHGIQGINDFKNNEYKGPCPPSGVHRYFFKIYALNTLLELKAGTTKAELEKTMGKHIIAFGQLIGTYGRVK